MVLATVWYGIMVLATVWYGIMVLATVWYIGTSYCMVYWY